VKGYPVDEGDPQGDSEKAGVHGPRELVGPVDFSGVVI
jgi:hypothetical protein